MKPLKLSLYTDFWRGDNSQETILLNPESIEQVEPLNNKTFKGSRVLKKNGEILYVANSVDEVQNKLEE